LEPFDDDRPERTRWFLRLLAVGPWSTPGRLVVETCSLQSDASDATTQQNVAVAQATAPTDITINNVVKIDPEILGRPALGRPNEGDVVDKPPADDATGNADDDPSATTPKRWTKEAANRAVAEYVEDRRQTYEGYKKRVAAGETRATELARKMFGRNVISKATGIPPTTLSKTPQWGQVKRDMGFGEVEKREAPPPSDGKKGGTAFDQVVRNETVTLARTHCPAAAADEILHKLAIGDWDDDQARLMIESYQEGQSGR